MAKSNTTFLKRREAIALGLGGVALASLPLPLAATRRRGSRRGRLLEYEELGAYGLPNQRLTIWLPPGYHKSTKRHRVLYMHDAQNLFDPALSNFNKVWAADRAMMRHADNSGGDPWIIVGIWSPGADRYRQYLPLPAYAAATGDLRSAMG